MNSQRLKQNAKIHMNSIECIKKFVDGKTQNKLIINQVNEEIGMFYLNFVESEAKSKKVNLNYQDKVLESVSSDLFITNKIDLCFSTSKKNIEEHLNSNNKCIIFTDYKNYKVYVNSNLTINGYNYNKDINYFMTRILKINNLEIIDFCLSAPYLTFSEISKYLVNSMNYVKEIKIKHNNNFIQDIRKEFFDLKRNKKSLKEIYFNLKEEVKYKKFNFLVY